MKTLKNFILEASEQKNEGTIKFNFSGLEYAEETLKSFANKSECSVEDETLTVSVTPDTVANIGATQDILQQYADKLMGSPKRSSDEQYAQKIRKFADKVRELNDKIDEIENPETEEEDKEGKDGEQ